MIQRLDKLSTADLERLAYTDPDDPTAPPVEVIRQAQDEIDRRDAMKFARTYHMPTVVERVRGIRI